MEIEFKTLSEKIKSLADWGNWIKEEDVREFIKRLKDELKRNNYPMAVANQIIDKLAGKSLI